MRQLLFIAVFVLLLRREASLDASNGSIEVLGTTETSNGFLGSGRRHLGMPPYGVDCYSDH